jgi:hypothetical protein
MNDRARERNRGSDAASEYAWPPGHLLAESKARLGLMLSNVEPGEAAERMSQLVAKFKAESKAIDDRRGQALSQALLALDAHICGSPSDMAAHVALDELEFIVARSYPAAMPWPVSPELKEKLHEYEQQLQKCWQEPVTKVSSPEEFWAAIYDFIEQMK